MYSEPLKCDTCGMILTNYEDLSEHRIAVHINGQLQCQSCGRFFEDKAALAEHASEVHSNVSQTDFAHKDNREEKVDDTESMLLKRTMEEEKTRKRTRGPYRKSFAA
jgi:DNA-directed RNA polymerase subunit M/transcription elongation factor TFIIS